MILINGGEIRRVVGYNFTRLHGLLEEAVELHTKELEYLGKGANTWERFYDNYDRWARNGEYDRDSMRIFYEGTSDRHRGVGSG